MGHDYRMHFGLFGVLGCCLASLILGFLRGEGRVLYTCEGEEKGGEKGSKLVNITEALGDTTYINTSQNSLIYLF